MSFRRIFGIPRPHDGSGQGAPARLIIGLGNPGPGYSGNRHNIGFLVVSYLARSHGMSFDRKKGDSRVAEGLIAGTPVMLARPQTYMNNSGRAANALLDKLKLGPQDLIVVHDDLDLPVGRIRIRSGGSSAGHKGVQSIIDSIASQDFVRVRVGIGRPPAVEGIHGREKDVMDYVLADFSADERSLIDKAVPRVAEAVECLITDGVVTAMNRYNSVPGKNVTREQSE